MIPSFHRPAIVRYDPNNHDRAPGQRLGSLHTYRTSGADSLSRILRPVAADGHDAATFPT